MGLRERVWFVAGLLVVIGLLVVVGQMSQPVRWVYFDPVRYNWEEKEYEIPGWWFDTQLPSELPSTDPIDKTVWEAQMHPFGH